jgi:hypothetical protein
LLNRQRELSVAPASGAIEPAEPTPMTPHEKAVNAINARLERLQANLRDAKVESSQRFLFQALVVTIGLAEALNDYIKGVGEYAQRRHAELKQAHESLGTEHAELLNTGKEMLEKFKATPTDRELRKEIDRLQQKMESIQKTVRRGANALQRELATSLAMIDEMAVGVRRFSEADDAGALKRVLSTMIAKVVELYAAQPLPPAKDIIDPQAWETSALAEVGQAVDFYDGYARTGYQLTLALELMGLAVSDNPPASAEDATARGNAAAAARLKAITARFATP